MDAEPQHHRRKRDNKAKCDFEQLLCVRFDVIFEVNAEIDPNSIIVECGR